MKKQDWHGRTEPKRAADTWLIHNRGEEERKAVCSRCGFELKAELCGQVYSLPVCCVGCGAHLQGFDFVKQE